MSEKALVSVIVPIYNVGKYLNKCIESVINQTYSNLEIILVDDGSTDNSLTICQDYAAIDERIKIIHQENSGAYSARKVGVKNSTGKYIAFVDGDDWIELNMYSDLVDLMEKYNTYMVESGIIDVQGHVENKRRQHVQEGHYEGREFIDKILPYMLYSGYFYESKISPNLWNKIFLASAVSKIFDEIIDGGKMANDTVITYPFLTCYNNIFVSDKCYYHYRVVNNSITRSEYSEIYDKLNVHINVVESFFLKSPYADLLLPQLLMHKLRCYAMYCPEIFDDDSEKILRIYGGVSKSEKIVIYGAGKSGIKAYNYAEKRMKNNIYAWVDKNYEYLSREISYNIKNPKEIDYCNVDKVVITALKSDAVLSIKDNLEKMGVDEKKICWIPQEYIENPQKALQLIT